MSSRNAYRIYVQQSNQRLYKRLHDKLNELFNGHVEVTSYGFYAEDSPEAGAVFCDNSPRGIRPDFLQRELSQPAYAEWDEFIADKEEYDDFDAASPAKTEPYDSIITSAVHEYQNDTSGADTETQLTFQ